MNELVFKEDLNIRAKIHALHLAMKEIEKEPYKKVNKNKFKKLEKNNITYRHLFTEKHPQHGVGMYAREMTACKGVAIVGYLHKDSHITFLNKGKMKIISEASGTQILEAPCSFVSPAGTKRAIFCVEDCVMTCVYISKTPEEDKKDLKEELTEELTSFEKSLYTEDYTEFNMLPPSNNYKGVLSW